MATAGRIRKILRPILWVVAFIYFLIDFVFVALVRPLAKRLDTFSWFRRVAAWVKSLGPYQSLFIFLIPLLILEPIKPVAAYLISQGRDRLGIFVLIVGEVAKVLILERVFHLTRPKLMSFKAFAWSYYRVSRVLVYLRSLAVWKTVRHGFQKIRNLIAGRTFFHH